MNSSEDSQEVRETCSTSQRLRWRVCVALGCYWSGSGKLRVFYWLLNTLGHSSCCFTSPLSLTRTTTDAQEQERNKHQAFDHSVLNRVEPLSLSSSCTSCFLPQPSLIKKQQRERSCGEASGFHLFCSENCEYSPAGALDSIKGGHRYCNVTDLGELSMLSVAICKF